MPKYRVKVTELHTDFVWVYADDEEEALADAHVEAQCEYECLWDCEIMPEEEKEQQEFEKD